MPIETIKSYLYRLLIFNIRLNPTSKSLFVLLTSYNKSNNIALFFSIYYIIILCALGPSKKQPHQ